MGSSLVIIDGTFGTYEADSAQGVVVDVSPDWLSFGGISHIAIFAFATFTRATWHDSRDVCRCDVGFMDVRGLLPMAARETKS